MPDVLQEGLKLPNGLNTGERIVRTSGNFLQNEKLITAGHGAGTLALKAVAFGLPFALGVAAFNYVREKFRRPKATE